MNHIVCIHHNDADGRASAAIVRRYYGTDALLYEMDYINIQLPWNAIENASTVVVVDFSLPLEDMKKIAAGRELIWIDHHKSALANLEPHSVAWKGIRNTDEAACVLTWKYFYPDSPIPRALVLIGDRDIWRWAEEDTGAFNEGLYQYDTHANNDELWKPLLDDDIQFVQQIINLGDTLRTARLRGIERLVKHYGYEVEFEGHQTLAINLHGNGDLGQHIRNLGYEIAYCYIDTMKGGQLYTSVTLFSSTVDVSDIARKFGGGGHEGAAGFSFPRGKTPFPPKANVKW